MNFRTTHFLGFAVLAAALAAAGFYRVRTIHNSPETAPVPKVESPAHFMPASDQPNYGEGTAQSLQASRKQLDRTVWAKEVSAQKHEETIVSYWDRMIEPADDKYAVLRSVAFDQITLGSPEHIDQLDWNITRSRSGAPDQILDRRAWLEWLDTMQSEGYEIRHVEFHQRAFNHEKDGTAHSIFSTELHVARRESEHRWIVKGDLEVAWEPEVGPDGLYPIRTLAFTDFTILEREGPRAFAPPQDLPIDGNEATMIAHDFDRDGDSDLAFPGENVLLRNPGTGDFSESTPLFTAPGLDPPYRVESALVADFTGDGRPDLVCAAYYETAVNLHRTTGGPALILFPADDEGEFSLPGRPAHREPLQLVEPMVLTAGDIDGDGDLDLFLGQYKTPYKDGQMPAPFYDAKDGYPAYLLINDGEGNFADYTDRAGLSAKRHRRTYSASFADLDGNRSLDLIVVNDFSGIDLYVNDGTGHFTDVTGAMVDEPASFGMAHTFADFDRDGMLDFYVVGMGSTTMRRLNQMGLTRADFPEYTDWRMRLGYGNRMYRAVGPGRYQQPEFKDQVARSGWSWGTTSLDFDLDGDSDIYIANGHISGNTTRDYCTYFWRHDIYQGTSFPNAEFSSLFRDTMRNGLSWDGYQRNHLLMNLDGRGFVNVAFLMGAAFILDGRAVLSDDFDLDGRPDLLVRSIRVQRETSARSDGPLNVTKSNIVQSVRNTWSSSNNWVGVRLYEETGAPSPFGAFVSVRANNRVQVGQFVSGDSYRSQHALAKVFGLGAARSVDYIEVTWPNGARKRIEDPAINQYHMLSALQPEEPNRD